MHKLRDVGGTPGGLGHFFLGLALAIVGGYLLMQRVTVYGGYWSFYGDQSFGVTLIPALLGVGALFYNGRSALGWLLFGGGMLIIFTGIIANMNIHFQPTSLFDTLTMLFLLVAGIGLIIRSLASHEKS